jgi:dihydroorotate dehydrogenase
MLKILNMFFCAKNETELMGIKFKNKVGLAAGLDKNAEVFDVFDSLGFGFVEIGTVTPKGQPGNPKPRAFRLVDDCSIINRMGFNNHGVDHAVENIKKIKKGNIVLGANIGKNTATKNEDAIADYVYCFKALKDYVDYFVINVSCPNVKNLTALQDTSALINIVESLKEHNQENAKPILLKISPDLCEKQVADMVTVVEKTGIEGIVAANTTTTRDNLVTNKNRIEEIGNGGLSGMAIKDKSINVIRQIRKLNNEMVIIGVGGIMTAQDAQEKIDAGANLVQLYTGFIYNGPGLVKTIVKRIKN